jgi:DNA-directed RNA polymerase specialized sigma24 family protein
LCAVEEVDLLTELHPAGQIPGSAVSELEAIWEEEWKTNLLEAALERVRRRVREEHYQIFDLCVMRQWKARDVAEALGVSVGQVYLAKHRVALEVKSAVRELQKKWP